MPPALKLILEITPVVIMAGGAVGTLVAWLLSRGKRSADVSALLTSTALELMDELREQLDAVNEKNNEVTERYKNMTSLLHDSMVYIDVLIQALQAAGIPVPPEPKPVASWRKRNEKT